MALAAHDAADRARQLTTVAELLTERLTVEAAAFEARRPQDVAAGVAETQRLANLYRHEAVRIKTDPALIEPAPLADKAALAEVVKRLDQVLRRHARALEAAKTLTEGLVHAIASEVAQGRAPSAYGAQGVAAAGDARAVTLNRQA
ncbi:flagellar basal-body protein FlbY [Brevundimonas sp. 2R-24]|uniref:Flagellar basal-body protein FlbY n=1 Tax=Peiella sedimenti TaxID=3061083 RepID=A0ABT8SMC6_9CAUL|nr:flagellar basal-body protein FlbY [Caulobacteraceae bacterium XZ-24]